MPIKSYSFSCLSNVTLSHAYQMLLFLMPIKSYSFSCLSNVTLSHAYLGYIFVLFDLFALKDFLNNMSFQSFDNEGI
jgi:hypothetical protein